MALHTYTPTEWKNAPDHKTTPINATNLNNIETGIDNAYTDISSIDTEVGKKAPKTDLASISETGATASQTISAGTYFYLDGVLVKALTAISSGAAFTENTNYEAVTAGGLNDVSSLVSGKVDSSRFAWTSNKAMASGTNFCNYPSGFAYDNCCVIGGRINTATGVYRQGLSWAGGLNTLSANIQFTNGDSSLNGKNWQLLLYKY